MATNRLEKAIIVGSGVAGAALMYGGIQLFRHISEKRRIASFEKLQARVDAGKAALAEGGFWRADETLFTYDEGQRRRPTAHILVAGEADDPYDLDHLSLLTKKVDGIISSVLEEYGSITPPGRVSMKFFDGLQRVRGTNVADTVFSSPEGDELGITPGHLYYPDRHWDIRVYIVAGEPWGRELAGRLETAMTAGNPQTLNTDGVKDLLMTAMTEGQLAEMQRPPDL